MSSILKTSPLSYRILIEKIDGQGKKSLVGDTGFVHISEDTKNFVQMLLEIMERDLEFRDKIEDIFMRRVKED